MDLVPQVAEPTLRILGICGPDGDASITVPPYRQSDGHRMSDPITSVFSKCVIAAAVFLIGCAQTKIPTVQGASTTPSKATLEEQKPPANWAPGSPHPIAPNVVAGANAREWVPAAGYDFLKLGELAVVWVPGLRHPQATNIQSAAETGMWIPEEGYDWIAKGKSWEVKWVPGILNRQFANVIAAETVGSWRPKPGYIWLAPQLNMLQNVRWAPGQVHADVPNIVAGTMEGTWNAAPGYQWINPNASSFQVRPIIAPHSSTSKDGIDWSGYMIKTFEGLGTDIESIRQEASGRKSSFLWRMGSNAQVGFAGAGTCLIPVAGYAALPVEFLYLMRKMYNDSLGMGFIISGSAARSDFANILAVWSGEMTLTDEDLRQAYEVAENVAHEVGQQIAEDVVERAVENTLQRFDAKDGSGRLVRPQLAPSSIRAPAPVISNALAQKSGAKTAGKLGAKVGAKTGAKIATKYAVKIGGGWIPGVSSVACAGANIYIMNDLLNAAELYYRKTSDYRARRYGSRTLN